MMQFSLQEVFDRTVQFLAAQGQPAVDCLSGGCKYRGQGNGQKSVKCAIGAWIPDATYAAVMEGAGIDLVGDVNAEGQYSQRTIIIAKAAGFELGSLHHKLLKALQKAHDGNTSGVIPFRIALTRVAGEFGLDGLVIAQVQKWD